MEARKGKGHDVPVSLDARQPFKRTAEKYLKAGWLPMPLPPGKKEEPPTGFTGWDSDPRKVNLAKVQKWISASRPTSNIANRSGHSHLGIDVDAYQAYGDETYTAIIEEIGEFPDTYISSARSDGKSGIRHYRLPDGYEGMKWPGTIGDAIQFVHLGHRYAVLPPSLHPKKDDDGNPQYYRWYAPGELIDGNGSFEVPLYEDLTELSVEIIEYFTKGEFAKHLPEKDLGSPRQSTKAVDEWIAARGGEMCSAMLRVIEGLEEAFGANGAHETMSPGFYRLAALSSEGHPGLATAAERLREAFLAEVGRDDRLGTARGAQQALDEWLRQRDSGAKKVMFREEAGEFIGSKCNCMGLTKAGRPKPLLDVNKLHIPTAIELCYKEMAACAERDWYGLYYSSGAVHVLDDREFLALDVDTLRGEVTADVDWIRYSGGEEPMPVPAIPPTTFVSSMLKSRAAKRILPELRGVTTSPFFAQGDDKPILLHENGYHPEASVFMRMDPKLEEAVHHIDRAQEDLEWAQKWIDEVLNGFPFVGAPDRAHAYAALILPFVRDLIEGPTPMHLIGAPTAGTGKSLLADVISMVACGEPTAENGRQIIGVGKGKNRDEELGKSITAMLRRLPRVVVLDNISGTLDSPALAEVLTVYPTYQGRVLGESKMTEMPNRPLWLATGNQFTAIGDIQRRIAPIRLDAHMPNPARGRSFGIADLRSHVLENRHRLVWAVLTLVVNWIEQGCPDGSGDIGSYESWVRVIGGILDANGIPGFLGNLDEFRDDSTEEGVASLHELFEEWADGRTLKIGEKYKAKEILYALASAQDLVDMSSGRNVKDFGVILKAQNGIPDGDLVLRRVMIHKVAFYRLERVSAPTVVKRGRKRRAT